MGWPRGKRQVRVLKCTALRICTAGSLAHSCVDRGVALVGASGGGYALIGAHFANIIRVRIHWFLFVTSTRLDSFSFKALCTLVYLSRAHVVSFLSNANGETCALCAPL